MSTVGPIWPCSTCSENLQWRRRSKNGVWGYVFELTLNLRMIYLRLYFCTYSSWPVGGSVFATAASCVDNNTQHWHVWKRNKSTVIRILAKVEKKEIKVKTTDTNCQHQYEPPTVASEAGMRWFTVQFSTAAVSVSIKPPILTRCNNFFCFITNVGPPVWWISRQKLP